MCGCPLFWEEKWHLCLEKLIDSSMIYSAGFEWCILGILCAVKWFMTRNYQRKMFVWNSYGYTNMNKRNPAVYGTLWSKLYICFYILTCEVLCLLYNDE